MTEAANNKKGENVVVLDASDSVMIVGAFTLANIDNGRLVATIVDEVKNDLRGLGAGPVHRGGVREGRWALLDHGSIVVYVFRNGKRGFCGLDRPWHDCPRTEVKGTGQPSDEDSEDSARSTHSIDEIPLAAENPDTDEF